MASSWVCATKSTRWRECNFHPESHHDSGGQAPAPKFSGPRRVVDRLTGAAFPVPNPSHSRRNGNPQPFLCTNTVIATEARQVGRPFPNPRHSRRNGNPEPLLCTNTVMATETDRLDGRCPTPSFSPQGESRAPPMHQHGHSNGDRPAGRPVPNPVILPAGGIQSPFYAPTRSWQWRHAGWTSGAQPRHSRRNGNPEPFLCANYPVTGLSA